MKLFIFKFIFYLASSVSLDATREENSGWFPVEQPEKKSEDEEVDPSIWVIFAKQIGDERFLVRFPEEPAYQYKDAKTLEVFSKKEGEEFFFSAERGGDLQRKAAEIQAIPGIESVRVDRKGEGQLDISYRLQGKWVQERIISTSECVYFFHTSSDRFNSENHAVFIESFHAEKTSIF